VQVIPHITNEIKDSIRAVAQNVDIVLVEIGGQVDRLPARGRDHPEVALLDVDVPVRAPRPRDPIPVR